MATALTLQELEPSTVLRIENFHTFEEFRPSGIFGAAKTVALDSKSISVNRATLALPECRLVLQRTFAREYDGELGAETCGLVVPMFDQNFHTLNGGAVRGDNVVFLRGIVPCRISERHPNTHALIRFGTGMQRRGWPEFERGLDLFDPTAQQMHRLRQALWAIAQHASACADPDDFARQAADLQESLYAAIDDILIRPDVIRARPRSFDRHMKVVAGLDELIRQTYDGALYSEDLAAALGTSVRTLQAAVVAVHGISLHRFIRLRKLWMVRRALEKGYPGMNVKAAAYAHGFWHLGEFSRHYKASFGEVPSETLTRARSRA